MKKVHFTALLAILAVPASAQELPRNLLLKCEGKVSVLIEGLPPQSDTKFEKLIRLKGGEIADADSPYLTAEDCALSNAVIRCSNTRIVDLKPGSELRKLQTFLSRDTGEYQLYLETKSFDGPNAKGKNTSSMRMRRTGHCRPVGGPLF